MGTIMQKLHLGIAVLALSLASCSEQPTEMEKAAVEKKLMPCLVNTTTQVGEKEANFMELITAATSNLNNLSDKPISKKWAVKRDPTLLTVTFDTTETKFECEYSKKAEASWQLENVHRNGQEVFNRILDEKNKAENHLIEQAKEELRRLEEKKNIKALISTWEEKKYSNVAYKYYQKRSESFNPSSFNFPSLRVSCNPEGTQFAFKELGWNYSGERGTIIKLHSREGVREITLDIADGGVVGKYNSGSFRKDVYFDADATDDFISTIKNADAIEIKNNVFKLNNFKNIPCITNQDQVTANRKKIAAIKAKKATVQRAQDEANLKVAKEKKRLAAISPWHKGRYTNAAYGFYMKRHQQYETADWSTPTVRISCNPKGTLVSFEDFSFGYSGEQNVIIKIKTTSGEESFKTDISSDGLIGKYAETQYTNKIYYDSVRNDEFLAKLRTAVSISVNDLVYNMDNLGEVLCLK